MICSLRRVSGMSVLAVVLAISSARAQVANPGFEVGSGGTIGSWTVWGGVGAEAWAARSGTNGLALYGWNAGGGVYQNVAAVGISNYTLSAYGSRDANFPSNLVAELKLEFLSSNTTVLASASKVVAGPTSWTQETLSATSPAGTFFVRPVILCSGPAGAGGAYKWDDVALASTPQAPAPGTSLVNGGMETQTGWVLANSLAYEPWAARSGSNGLAMYGWTTGGSAYQDVSTTGASNYTFTVYGYKDTNFDLRLLRSELRMSFYASAGSTQELAGFTNRIDYAPAAWTQYGISGSKPASATIVRVTLAFNGSVSGGAFKWDDAALAADSNPNPTHYVSTTGGNVFPYTSWSNAARSIEAAVAAALNGDTVLVSNGTYTLIAPVAVDRAITVRGANGYTNTVVDGANTTRCFYVSNPSATIDGLTISNGNAFASVTNLDGGAASAPAGGGAIRAPQGAKVVNCRVVNNKGRRCGGGIEIGGGVVSNCLVVGNAVLAFGIDYYYNDPANGGGIYATGSVLVVNSRISNNVASAAYAAYGTAGAAGGGVYADGALIRNCKITDNAAASTNGGGRYGPGAAVGAGVYIDKGAEVRGCEIVRNSITATNVGMYGTGASGYGAGIYAGMSWTGIVESCTIVANSNVTHAAGYGSIAGLHSASTSSVGRVLNSILFFNMTTKSSTTVENWGGGALTYSYDCTTPAPSGVGHLTDDPHFIQPGLYRMEAGSTCIGRASQQSWMLTATDLDGYGRVVGPGVDIGAYEYQSSTGGFNMLLNGNLERREVWVLGGDIHHEPWAAKYGTNGLAMYGWATNGGFAYQDVLAAIGTNYPSFNGTSYTFSAWGYRDTNFNLAVHKPELKIEFFNGASMVGAVTNRITNAPASWSKFAVTGNAPASATIVRAVLAYAAPASGGAFKWDDLQLVCATTAGNMARPAGTDAPVADPDVKQVTKAVEVAPAAEPVKAAPAAVATVTAPVAQAAPAASGEPTRDSFAGQGGLVVVTSDDLGLQNLGRPAVDGNLRTAWTGEAGAGGWWIAVQYPQAIKARNVRLQLAKGSLPNTQVLYSTDAKTWQDLGPALKSGKVDLKYLWFIFADDGSGAVPVVKEIGVKAAK